MPISTTCGRARRWWQSAGAQPRSMWCVWCGSPRSSWLGGGQWEGPTSSVDRLPLPSSGRRRRMRKLRAHPRAIYTVGICARRGCPLPRDAPSSHPLPGPSRPPGQSSSCRGSAITMGPTLPHSQGCLFCCGHTSPHMLHSSSAFRCWHLHNPSVRARCSIAGLPRRALPVVGTGGSEPFYPPLGCVFVHGAAQLPCALQVP